MVELTPKRHRLLLDLLALEAEVSRVISAQRRAAAHSREPDNLPRIGDGPPTHLKTEANPRN